MLNKSIPIFIISAFCVFESCSMFENTNQGERLYLTYCSSCHMDNGSGLGELYPPLANSDFLADNQELIPCIIRYGINTPLMVNGIVYDIPMEGIKELNDIEIHNIIRYINSAWNNNIPIPNFKETELQLENCL